MNYLIETENEIKDLGFDIISKDYSRPWGGFLVIKENQAQKFTDKFFDGISAEKLKIGGKLSPKILIVKPNSKLSWQYHQRRAELWRISVLPLQRPLSALLRHDVGGAIRNVPVCLSLDGPLGPFLLRSEEPSYIVSGDQNARRTIRRCRRQSGGGGC